MKKLSECETKEDVIKWMTRKKEVLDSLVVRFIDETHSKINEIEERGRKRLSELE